jgi:hypothetical protein
MGETKENTLQHICREYLNKLKPIATKFGLKAFVEEMIDANFRGECVSTEREVQMLSRMCDDERVSRADIPKILGKSYRQANEDGDFCRIKKLKRQGIYSKLSVLLYKSKYEHKRKNKVS